MKAVIIGCGLIARSHGEAIEAIDGVRLVGVCDEKIEKAEELAKVYDCMPYADASRMLEELSPDIAIICVPTFLHNEFVKLCVEKGVNVLCEKPLERNFDSAKDLIEAVNASDIIFMTAQVVRFWPGYVNIKEMFANEELGKIYMMHFRRVSSRSGEYSNWLFDPQLGGGALHDMLVHDVDFLRYICGPFKKCYANAVKDDTGCYNNVMANIIHKNGVQGIAEVSFNMQTNYPFSFSVNIVGSEATIEYSFSAGTTIADRSNTKREMKIWRKGSGLEEISLEDYDPYLRQMEYFIDCVKRKEKPEIITPEESLEVIEMIDALHKSADTGRIIELG